jgi:hypothetical protein
VISASQSSYGQVSDPQPPVLADEGRQGHAVRSNPRALPGALQAHCLIARLHHIAADPAHLAHRLGWPARHLPGVEDLLLAAREPGLQARRVAIDDSAVDRDQPSGPRAPERLPPTSPQAGP